MTYRARHVLAIALTVAIAGSIGADRSSAAPAVQASATYYIITATPGRETDRIAARYRARRLGYTGAVAQFKVAAKWRAKMMAELKKAGARPRWGPDSPAESTQAPPPDPFDPYANWRPLIVDPTLVPPPVGSTSRLLAIVDDPLDPAHPEFVGSETRRQRQMVVRNSHGIATAAIAGAPSNGTGITGVWPGMRVVNVPLPSAENLCSDRIDAIGLALRQQPAVLALEYGSKAMCFGEAVMVQLAISRSIVVVAGAGTLRPDGGAARYPGALPHVITVAAVTSDLQRAPFSAPAATVDLAAPGDRIFTAVRPGDPVDPDGDGYGMVSGTSFAAPMVAAAAAWLGAARPELTRSEIEFVLRLSARRIRTTGWNAETGMGLVDIAKALKQELRFGDHGEANDDIPWVDGSIFATPDRQVGRRDQRSVYAGSADKREDPADVYRVAVPARGRVRVSVDPIFGDPDITSYTPEATTIAGHRERLSAPHRRGEVIESVTLRNRSRQARTFFVAVTPETLNTYYELIVDPPRR